MIIGTGIDITEISRIKELYDQHEGFPKKILTERELELFKQCPETKILEFLAGRFSVKESIGKAFGTGIGEGFKFHDISVLKKDNGSPEIIKEIDIPYRIHVSISHTDALVVSQSIIEEK